MFHILRCIEQNTADNYCHFEVFCPSELSQIMYSKSQRTCNPLKHHKTYAEN